MILARNEVLDARSWPNGDLFIVTEIAGGGQYTDHPVENDRVAHLCRNWKPAEEALTPLGFDYVWRWGRFRGQPWRDSSGRDACTFVL
jgi:hypothetical protein